MRGSRGAALAVGALLGVAAAWPAAQDATPSPRTAITSLSVFAGTASGLMGCLQMGAAAVTTMAVGFVQDATPQPMIAVIAVTTLLGLLAALAARGAGRRA